MIVGIDFFPLVFEKFYGRCGIFLLISGNRKYFLNSVFNDFWIFRKALKFTEITKYSKNPKNPITKHPSQFQKLIATAN
jgi:hypothetical protein